MAHFFGASAALNLAAILPVNPGATSQDLGNLLIELAVSVAGLVNLLPEAEELIDTDRLAFIGVNLVEHRFSTKTTELAILLEEVQSLLLGDLSISVKVHHLKELANLVPGSLRERLPPSADHAATPKTASRLGRYSFFFARVLADGILRHHDVASALRARSHPRRCRIQLQRRRAAVLGAPSRLAGSGAFFSASLSFRPLQPCEFFRRLLRL
mmetsp:Transcript_57439/g.168182  ORF Transcript_57439/g.168182 Transcript_57439/m.168182 type:complete len:213 (-) Transcript_57439:328-966(-)